MEKDLKIKFDKATSTKTEFKFMIDSIQRFENDSKINIAWDGDDVDIEVVDVVTLVLVVAVILIL